MSQDPFPDRAPAPARPTWPDARVPDITPVRLGRVGRHRLRRALYGRRRMAAAGLAVAAAAMAVTAARADQDGRGGGGPGATTASKPDSPPSSSPRGAPGGREEDGRASSSVSVPVRIADAATVRLLHPGDRVDVIAGQDGTDAARIVARSVRVAQVPEDGHTVSSDGALVVLAVPRKRAAELAGAAAGSRLAVALC